MKFVMVRKTALAVLAAAALAVTAQPAAAGSTISLTAAKATAQKAGATAARQTGGKRPQVLSCRRTSSRRALCKVKVFYSSGARSCVIDVIVKFKSRRSTQLVYSFGQTACS